MSLKTEASIRESKQRRKETRDRLAQTRSAGKGVTSKEYIRRGLKPRTGYTMENPYG